MAKANKKGRTKGERGFALVTHEMMDSPAWRGLSCPARAVLLQVWRRYNGRNNGRLAASARDLAAECRLNKDTAVRALKELQEARFLILVTQGGFSRKVRHAAEYRLVWMPCDVTGAPGERPWNRKANETGEPSLEPVALRSAAA
jgi:hypothetical protein